MGYLSNFIVYFFAMVGIIILALWVYQKFNVNSIGIKSKRSLKIEDSLSLSARKTLYVVRNKNERFLIAADMERTTLISKLADDDYYEEEDISYTNNVNHINPNRLQKGADLSERGIRMQDNVAPIKKPIMREIKNKLRF